MNHILDIFYFLVFRKVKNHKVRFNLMGMISFTKSGIKHFKRRSPTWMIKEQVKGFFICLKQLFE